MIKIEHIGIVVEDIEKSINIFVNLGFQKLNDICIDQIQNNKLQILQDANGNKIELIQPLNEKSTVINAKVGIHHIAIINQGGIPREKIQDNKIGKIFSKKIMAPLFDNRTVEFAYIPNNNIIIELIEE